jgi:mannosyl-3-phosphoglycerate phosphatase
MKRYLIFTDLDGTLLNHENYSYGNNNKIITSITNNQHDLIFNTSKTFSESINLLKKLNLTNMPFSTENGALLYFPKNRFKKIRNSSDHGKYWKIRIAKLSSKNWHQFLIKKQKKFKLLIAQDLPPKILKKYTNLDNTSKMLKREASQIILWEDSLVNLKKFKNELRSEKQGVLIQGSRFMQVSSVCNKRIAKKLISHAYDYQFYGTYSKNTIALGDSKNDIDMLNSASYPCLIKNPSGPFPKLRSNKKNIIKSSKFAPDGWSQVLYKLNNMLESKIF